MERRNATVAVIGAGDFIGSAIARKFAGEGCSVFAGRRNGDKLAAAPVLDVVEETPEVVLVETPLADFRRCGAPAGPLIVASAIFVAGSKGVKFNSCGVSASRTGVAVAAAPEPGFDRFERWIADEHRDVRWMLRKNLTKARMRKADPRRCLELDRRLAP